ncbi:hypothetical protein ACA910_001970 [Epithemia clementina (nom. ined.)]
MFMLNGNTHLLERKLLALPATAPVVLLTDTVQDRFVWKAIRWRRTTIIRWEGSPQVKLCLAIDIFKTSLGRRPFDAWWAISSITIELSSRRFLGGTLPGPHYTETSALRAQYSVTPVVYPTFWSCTGFGFRELAPSEFGAAFDLPSWISPRSLEQWLQDLRHAPKAFIPLKLGTQFLYKVVLQLEPAAMLNFSPVVVRKRPLPTAVPTVSFTIFPNLHQNLSSSWINQRLVLDNAAKDDDATDQSQLWDNHLIGLFPWTMRGGRCPRALFESSPSVGIWSLVSQRVFVS